MSLLRYPGGKGKLATRLVSVIHDYFDRNRDKRMIYCEPFFGAGAIGLRLLEKTAIQSVAFNDYDPAMYSVWKTVKEQPTALIEKVEAFSPSIEAFHEFKAFLLALKPFADDTHPKPPAGEDMVDIAFKKIAVHQMSYSGLGTKSGGPLGGAEQKSAYKVGCRWSPKQLKKEITRINRLMASKKTWDEAHQRYWDNCHISGFQFYHAWPLGSVPAFIYLDPPYYEKGPELYQFSFSDEQHEGLSRLLRHNPHPWLLSYDDCPQVRALYDYAAVREVPLNYSINGAITKTELLITPKGYEFLLDDPTVPKGEVDIGEAYYD
jgi:DNA adenine methylase